MEQHPNPKSHIALRGHLDTTALSKDPFLFGSVQPVPAPPTIKPPPPTAPPPPNATVYDPSKDVDKFTSDNTAVHDLLLDAANASHSDHDDDANNVNDPRSLNQVPLQTTPKYNVMSRPIKRRKIGENEGTDRFSLCSLGFQPLAARAIVEELESRPKLRYSDEFRRDITR